MLLAKIYKKLYRKAEDKTKKYIVTLVDRMLNHDDIAPRKLGGIRMIFSSDGINWKALREAEALTDYRYFVATKELLVGESNQQRKSRYYFILIRFWKTTNDEKVLRDIFRLLLQETNNNFITQQLMFIKGQYRPIKNCVPELIKFLDRGDLNFKINAASLFSRVAIKLPDIEGRLLKFLSATKKKHQILEIASALSAIGSEKSIAPLRKLMSPVGKDEYDASMLFIISNLGKDKYVKLYQDNFINSRNPNVKRVALIALYQYSNDVLIANEILDRAKKLLTSNRKIEMAYQDDCPPSLVYCLMYLQKINSILFDKLMQFIKQHKEKLFEAEKKHISNQFKIKIGF